MKKGLFLSLSILIWACQKEDHSYPLIYTGEVTGVTATGAIFSARMADVGKQSILDFGFVWNTSLHPTLENSERYEIEETPKIGIFTEQISTTLNAGVIYYVRAYARSSGYITYGKEVSFTSLGSLGPGITGFTPKTANLNDTLTIIGKNFSYRTSENAVKIGGFPAIILSARQDTLVVRVPLALDSAASRVSVTIQGNRGTSADKFNLIAPVITGFAPATGTYGSTITITGNNFTSNAGSVHVYVDRAQAKVVTLQNQSISILVPDSLTKQTSYIKVVMNNVPAISTDQFQLASLSLSDFSPHTAVTGSSIILNGNNFSSIAANNTVTVGGLNAVVTHATATALTITLPLQSSGYYSSRSATVSVEVLGQTQNYAALLLINDRWFRHKDMPIDVTGSFSALANNKAYVGINDSKGLWSYDPVVDAWTRLSDFPGIARSDGDGFILNNTIYFGTGTYINFGSNDYTNDFWAYAISSDSWVEKADFPMDFNVRSNSVGFAANGHGYLGGGTVYGIYTYFYKDFWEYDASRDQWTEISDYPTDQEDGYENGLVSGVSAVVGNTAYVGSAWDRTQAPREFGTWNAFHAGSNTWTSIAQFPYTTGYGDINNAIGFTLAGIPYVKTTSSSFYSYDASSDSWQNVATGLFPNNVTGIGFAIGMIGYVGIQKTLWEYDPSR